MSKKDEFVKAFEAASDGKHPKDFKEDLSTFTKIVNNNKKVNDLYWEAMEEFNAEPTAGLGNLFSGLE